MAASSRSDFATNSPSGRSPRNVPTGCGERRPSGQTAAEPRCSSSPASASTKRGRLSAAARVHRRRPRLREGQRRLQLRQPDRRAAAHDDLPLAVRSDLERPGEARRRHRQALRAHRLRVSGEFARAHLLPDALQHLQRVPGRHQRGRTAERPDGLPGQPRLEEALQLPARRRHRHHQQAGDLQRLHPRRQRRPREDVHRSCRHQILRAAQPLRPRPLPEEAGGQLAELQRQPRHEHLRQRPLRLTTCSATPTFSARAGSPSACRSTA